MFHEPLKPELSTPSVQSAYVPVAGQEETTDTQVEDYLDRFCQAMVGVTSSEEQHPLRDGKRREIQAMVAAREELGDSREQAVALTLDYMRRQAVSRASVVVLGQTASSEKVWAHSRRVALQRFGFASALVLPMLLATGDTLNVSGGESVFFALAVALPALAGATVGLRVRERPLRATAHALAIVAIPTALQYAFWAHLHGGPLPLGILIGCVHMAAAAGAGLAATAVAHRLHMAFTPRLAPRIPT